MEPPRPLLFLDVDGVINACDPSLTDCDSFQCEGFTIRVRHHVPACLKLLHEHFEVVWCTTWCERAEPCFAKRLGLPGTRDYVRWEERKLPSLLEYAGGCPCAFVDDTAAWELREFPKAGTALCYVVAPDPRVGLTCEQTDKLVAYARLLAPVSEDGVAA